MSCGLGFGGGRRPIRSGRHSSGGRRRCHRARSISASPPSRRGDGSPDLAWLRDASDAVHWYRPGDRLAVGIDVYAGREDNDVVLWIESFGAVVGGDSLADFGTGLAPNEWLRGGVTRERALGSG